MASLSAWGVLDIYTPIYFNVEVRLLFTFCTGKYNI